MILDIGPTSMSFVKMAIASAGTIIWNGPVGVFEFDAFAGGTKALAEAIAQSHAFSIAGGGDTVAAIAKFGVGDRIGYISTGGGAFLEFLEGKTLPAVEVLETARGGLIGIGHAGDETRRSDNAQAGQPLTPTLSPPGRGSAW